MPADASEEFLLYRRLYILQNHTPAQAEKMAKEAVDGKKVAVAPIASSPATISKVPEKSQRQCEAKADRGTTRKPSSSRSRSQKSKAAPKNKKEKTKKNKTEEKKKKLQTPESDENEAPRQVQLRKLGRQTEKPVLRGQKQDRSNQGRNGREWPMHQARKIKVFGQRPRQLQRISEKAIQSRRHRLASSECDLL